MEQDQRGGTRPAGDPSAKTNAGSGKQNSEGASASGQRRRLPFGAGILPQTPAASETPKVSPEPEAPPTAEAPAPEEPVIETPTSEMVPAPEPVAPAEAMRPQERAADSSPEAALDADAVAGDEAEALGADEDIPDYNIIDPPDEPEEDDFDKVLPGPTEEVRFDEGPAARGRFSRPRQRGTSRRQRVRQPDSKPQPSPPVQASPKRAARPILIVALIVLAVILAALAAIVLF